MIQDLLQQHLNRARQLMKSQADKKRSFRSFEIGDQVFLKLQPYIQNSIAPRANHKLEYKFYGPFAVIGKINEVAYKLQLPPQATVHPVFHVSQLRRALLPGMVVEPSLPNCSDNLAVPTVVLQTRWRKKNGGMCEQVKVQRSNSAAMGTTWEDKASLLTRFPYAEAWGQASTKGEGDVGATDAGDPPGGETEPLDARPQRAPARPKRYYGPEWLNPTN